MRNISHNAHYIVLFKSPRDKQHISGFDVVLNINSIEKLLTRQKVIPLSGKVVFIWEKHYPGHRDLACLSVHGKTFRLV
jgi:hypothetical protein